MTRTVTVVLRANNAQYDASMDESGRKTKKLEDATKTATGHSRQSFQDLGRTSIVVGAALAGAFGLAAKAAMDFNAEMSLVKTLSHAGVRDMTQLRAAALTMGQAIGYSAVQTANAETELVKAGISVSDIMGGALKGSLDLAAAGQTDVASATETAAIAMTQFKLAGSDVPHIADLLAAGADKALGSVGDLSSALKAGGLVASQFGFSIEDTIGTLSAFAQAGLMGESAGTDLRQMLLKLAAPSVQSAQTMQDLGISIYDASGKFVGITNLAGQLHDKLSKLTQAQRDHAMAVMFGARAIVGANILYANGAKGIEGWITTVNDSGFAARQAAGKMDNLKGDLSKLGAAFRNDLIESGSTADGTLRGLTQAATGALNEFGHLPKPVQEMGVAFAGIGGTVLLAGGAMLVAVPKVVALDKALRDMTDGSIGAKAALGGLLKAGLLVGAVVGTVEGIGVAADHLAGAGPSVDKLTESLITFATEGKAAGDVARLFGADFQHLADLVKAADKNRFFSISPGDSTVDITRARKEIDGLDKSLADLVNSGHADVAARAFAEIKSQLALGGVSSKDTEKAFNDYYAALDSVTSSALQAGHAVDQANGPIRDQAAAAKAASDALTAQADALKALTDPIFAMANAMSGQRQAQSDLADAIAKHGRNSREATDALFGLAKANADVTSSADALAAGVAAGTTSVEDMRAQLRIWVSQGLLTSAQADSLGSKIEGLTSKAKTLSDTPAKVNVSTTGVPTTLRQLSAVEVAKRRAAAAISVPIQVTGLDSFYRTLATAHTAAAGNVAHGLPQNLLLPGATPAKHAAGGLLDGPGSGTSDSMLIRASSGEFVVNAAQTSKHLGLLRAINAGVQGFASGGLVIPPPTAYRPSASLSSQALALARHGHGADDIQALVAAYDDYLHRLDQAAQREKLLADIRAANAEAAKTSGASTAAAYRQIAAAQDALTAAETKHHSTAAAERQMAAAQDALTKAQTKGTQDHAAALQKVNDAVKALADFDQAAKVEKEKAAVDRLVTSLQKQADARAELYRRQDNAYAVGQRSANDEIAGLTKRMAAEVKFSDAWTSLYQQRKQVLDDVAQASKDAADAAQQAADRAKQSLTDQLGSLNQMLDQAASIHAQLAQSSASYADKQQQLTAREQQAQATLQAGMVKAQQDYADAEQRILHGRQDTLTGWASLTERANVTWGNTLGQIQSNVTDQITNFQEWMDRLADARRRGVSEAVVSALGLDQGPQALGQLRQFSNATQAQIDALNATVTTRTALAGQEVHREQVAGYGQMGADLTAAQQQYQEAILGLQDQYRTEQAAIATDLQQAQQTFMTEQTDLTVQLAQIGVDQGRTYGDAVAAGIASGLPGILAQVAAVQAAMAQLTAAPGSTPAVASPAPTATATATAAAPAVSSAVYVGGSPLPPETAANDKLISSMRESDWTERQRAYADLYGLSGTSVFDTGGWLLPGYTLAYNGTGAPERVMTAQQMHAADNPAQYSIQVFVGDREITDIVDVRIDSTLGQRRAVAQVAGSR